MIEDRLNRWNLWTSQTKLNEQSLTRLQFVNGWHCRKVNALRLWEQVLQTIEKETYFKSFLFFNRRRKSE